MIEIIAVVIVTIVIIKQNGRLSRLEKDIANLLQKRADAPRAVSNPQMPPVGEGTQGAKLPENNIQPPVSQSSPYTASTRQEQPVQTEPKKSDEEASGRLLGKIGIAAVIVGVGFFLKYAFDNNWIGPSGRVMLGIFVGIILLGLGQFLRKKYLNYSDLLMGGGIAVLYLAIFSAHSFYNLISPTTAGLFMLLVTALSFALSIANATPILAMISVIGGFATPFLVGIKVSDVALLFGYLTILNLGILAISSFKKWPQLIIAAFVGTAVNFGSWFDANYTEAMLGMTLLFCFVSFLIFLFASVARAVVGKAETDQPNIILLGANSIAIALLGYILLMPKYEWILGYASVFVALIHMAVAFIVNKFNPENKVLNIFLPGLAVTFLSLAVPLQLSGPWIAVAWLVESVVLYVVASSISNRGFQVMGAVVYVLGLVNFFAWNFPKIHSKDFVAIFNSHFAVLILAIIVSYAIAHIYLRYGSMTVEIQKRGIAAFVILANILTIYALSSQIIFYHNAKILRAEARYSLDVEESARFNTGYDTSSLSEEAMNDYYKERSAIANRSHTYVSVLWTLYAAILTAIGFGKRMASVRRLGLILFFITAVKVLFDVWSLGQLYRIVSFIVFGIIALAASFAYTKYKDRLKEII